MRRALLLSLLLLGLLPNVADAAPCGRDRCRLFRAGAGPNGHIAPGPDGALWFTANGYVGRITRGGDVTKFSAPVGAGSDITPGVDGAVWFSTGDGRLGRVTPDGAISLHDIGIELPLGPAAVALGLDGRIWFLVGRTAGRMGPDGQVARFALPPQAVTGGPGSLAAGPDGAMWFTQGSRPAIGRLTVAGDYTEAPIPFPGPFGGIVAGPDSGMWFTAIEEAKWVGRIGMDGRIIGFPLSQRVRSTIAAGPSHSIWFTTAGGGAQSIVRMTTAGFKTFFQLRGGGARDLAVGANAAIFMTREDGIERLTTFLGARPIRTRTLRVNPFAGSVSLRLFCPKFDLVFCAGEVTLLYRGRVIGGGPFSQRVNDAPATRLRLNAYGRRVIGGGGRRRALMTIVQHDQGGSTRRTTQAVYLRRRG
jgi:virginiamycin B lyase